MDLDVDTVGRGKGAFTVARVAVVGTHGCTRDGSAETITADCRSVPALEREVGRLRDELDDALDKAAAALGESVSAATLARSKPAASKLVDATLAMPARLGNDLTVGQLMTRDVVTVLRNDPLTEAKQRMESGGFRHLVVLDENGEIAGVLSQLDIVFNSLAWSLGESRRAYESALERITVKEAMQPDTVTVDPSDLIAAAARLMIERKIGCLPVVEAEVLVGIVTESDLLALFVDDQPLADGTTGER